MTANIITNWGIGHSLSHCKGWQCDRIGTKIYAHIFSISRLVHDNEIHGTYYENSA